MWMITGQVGPHNATRFTNPNDVKCPPNSGWLYNNDVRSNLTINDIGTTNKPTTNKPSDVIRSSHPYGPDENIMENINPNCKNIEIDFEYSTEYGYDYLYIGSNRYSGNGTNSITEEVPLVVRSS